MQSHFGFKIRVSIGFFYIFLPLYRNGFAVRCTIHCRWDFQISSHNLFYQSYKNKDLSSFQTLTLIKKKKKGKMFIATENKWEVWERNELETQEASLMLCKWWGGSVVVWAKWSFWVSLCCEFLWEMKKIMKYKIRKCKTKTK